MISLNKGTDSFQVSINIKDDEIDQGDTDARVCTIIHKVVDSSTDIPFKSAQDQSFNLKIVNNDVAKISLSFKRGDKNYERSVHKLISCKCEWPKHDTCIFIGGNDLMNPLCVLEKDKHTRFHNNLVDIA